MIRPGGETTKFSIPKRYTNMVMSTRYRKSPYTARVALKSLRGATLVEICKEVKKEVKTIASRKDGDSLLRLGQLQMSQFSWKPIVKELRRDAPVLFSVLSTALSKNGNVKLADVGITASILLKNFCTHLALPQAIVSVILYSGHCSKQVNIVHVHVK